MPARAHPQLPPSRPEPLDAPTETAATAATSVASSAPPISASRRSPTALWRRKETILFLYLVRGWSARAIAQRLGLHRSAVQRLIAHAVRQRCSDGAAKEGGCP
jgi:DNA-directed RNA polymerase specialized sigma24 family protein